MARIERGSVRRQEERRPGSRRRNDDRGPAGGTTTGVPQEERRPGSRRRNDDRGAAGGTTTGVPQEERRPGCRRRNDDRVPQEERRPGTAGGTTTGYRRRNDDRGPAGGTAYGALRRRSAASGGRRPARGRRSPFGTINVPHLVSDRRLTPILSTQVVERRCRASRQPESLVRMQERRGGHQGCLSSRVQSAGDPRHPVVHRPLSLRRTTSLNSAMHLEPWPPCSKPTPGDCPSPQSSCKTHAKCSGVSFV